MTFKQARESRLTAFEIAYLTGALRVFNGDVSRAAREADLPRGTFYRLLKKYNIAPSFYRS